MQGNGQVYCAVAYLLMLSTTVFAVDRPEDTPRVGAGKQLQVQLPRSSSGPPSRDVMSTGEWAVRLRPGEVIDSLAQQLGAVAFRPLGNFPNTYMLTFPDATRRSQNPDTLIRSAPAVQWFAEQHREQRTRRVIPVSIMDEPLFNQQWHLDADNDVGFSLGTLSASIDAGVVQAWDQQQVDGSGIVIGIVDDGLEVSHPDLATNVISSASYDYNRMDTDPSPNSGLDIHGTAVAGIAAATDNGLRCGVGVAYNAGLAGLQVISAPSTDAEEARALDHDDPGPQNKQQIQVFNNSWGPADYGWIADGAMDAERYYPFNPNAITGAGPLARSALEEGATQGREGKGVIYVWAAGNGLAEQDNVTYDNYANSPYTIAVAAVEGYLGRQAYYSEPGAALLVSAPSNSRFSGEGIRTTDVSGVGGYNSGGDSTGDDACTDSFGGTSAASPMVAGVVALMLQANPQLGWRDVQAILLQTARRNDPQDEDWVRNGAGYFVNHKYGFGLVNAQAAVAAARDWVPLEAAMRLDSGLQGVDLPIPDNLAPGISQVLNVPQEMQVEHVELELHVQHPFRGDLRVELISPSGTSSLLAEPRIDPYDDLNWTFMTVRNWGENAAGTWTLLISDEQAIPGYSNTGRLLSWRLILHGAASGDSNPTSIPYDYSGDARADVLLRNLSSGKWQLYEMDGATIVRKRYSGLGTHLSWQYQANGDFNGDGTADVVQRNVATGEWKLLEMAGARVLRRIPLDLENSLDWMLAGVGDFNADGRADILLRHRLTGKWKLYEMDGGEVLRQRFIWLGSNLDWQLAGLGDFTRDGKVDVLLRNAVTGNWKSLFMDGATVLSRGTPALERSRDWRVQAVADFSGDGHADVLLRSESTGAWRLQTLSQRNLVADESLSIWTNARWQLAQVSDFNGDSFPDILLRNSVTHRWKLFEMYRGEVLQVTTPFLTNQQLWEIQ